MSEVLLDVRDEVVLVADCDREKRSSGPVEKLVEGVGRLESWGRLDTMKDEVREDVVVLAAMKEG